MVKYNSSREIMKAMDDGIIPRAHLGAKSFEVLKQELFSLKNEYTPNTSTEQELNDWNIKLAARIEEIEHLPQAEKNTLFFEVNKMLNPTS